MTSHDIHLPCLCEPADEVEWRARIDAGLLTDGYPSDGHRSLEVIMNDAFSFSISIGIMAFGIWIAAGTIGVGSPFAWMLLGLLPVMVGAISLYLAIREVRTAPRN